ncbi:MAG: type II toxin-antitoxin system VapC family toxin [Gemmatimonadaceae bacterium]|nr:type II toxin-antitoxin system VapC family toxin [Gemmatimonadaceae bacterium]
MIVVDASAMIELLLRTPLGQRIEARLFDTPSALHAPELLDVEVVQVLRQFEARGELSATRSATTLRLLDELPVRRYPHAPLVSRMWPLRSHLTAYDATYVALSEALAAVLITCDARLARAPGVRAVVEVV